jgi:protein-disulfide isomerase
MATGPQQKRKELREKRLKAEAAAKGTDRRQNLVKIIGAAAFVVVVGIAVVVGISLSGGDEPSKGSEEVEQLLTGIPQQGTVLGDPDAKVTLVEFADLQCPACRQVAEEVLPDVIDGPIRNGRAKLEFNNWAILGPDSVTAARAALAASLQNRLWQFTENFYANQSTEGTGYVNDEFLTDIAEKAGVPDIDKWNEDREDPRWEETLLATDDQAAELGLSGTPSFAVRSGDGELQTIDSSSADAIIQAINQAQ